MLYITHKNELYGIRFPYNSRETKKGKTPLIWTNF